MNKRSLVVILLMILSLYACNSELEEMESAVYSIENFPEETTDQGKTKDGGTLQFGLVSDTAFEGKLHWNFYSSEPDAQILKWIDEPLLAMNENRHYTDDGAASYEVSADEKTFTFTIREGVRWHDGIPVTAEDWAFSYEVIGHPDYEGIRYGTGFTNIEGMEAYHNEEANEISGIEVIDDKTLQITYKEPTPSLAAGGIWPYAMPKHIFEDIPVAEMAASDAVRRYPVGMGPFKVSRVTPGESIILKANKDYWQGEPVLDGVTIQVISPSNAVQSLRNGSIDMLSSFPVEQYPYVARSLPNVEFLGDVAQAYSYLGFKLGEWDAEKGEAVMDPDAKMADKVLRQAMGYAIDNEAVGREFYHGLRWNATSLIPPSYANYHDSEVETSTYQPEKAEQMLDEAGYADVDNDGFRENPEGEPLVINFAAMSGGDTAEAIAQYYVQSFRDVGLNVQLVDGRPLEFHTFYQRIEADDAEIDMYQGAWGTGSDVDPAPIYGRDAMLNYTRYTSDENDALLEAGVSKKAFNPNYRRQVYQEWQQLMAEEVPVIPTLYRATLIPVNKRVQNYSIVPGWSDYHEISLEAGADVR